MNEYELGQTVYYISYLVNIPSVEEFLIAAVRETEAGFQYSKFENPASPYMEESQLFETIDEAIAYQISLLEALIPPAP